MTKQDTTPGKRARTQADRLKQAGLNASRMNLTLLEPEALTLITDPAHPLYDERVNILVDPGEPLYLDIKVRGVEKPVEVRQNGERDGRPILQVVDGRQRVMILRDINAHLPEGAPKRKIPVRFVHGDDREMVLRGLSSNLLRREETVLSKAVKAQKAMALGCGLDEIALACNLRTTKPIEEWLLVLNFIPEVRAAFNGELPASAIKTFAKVPREDQLKTLETLRASGAKGGRQVKAAVEAAQKGEKYVAPEGRTSMTPAQIEKLLVRLVVALDTTKAAAEAISEEVEAAALKDELDDALTDKATRIGSRLDKLEGSIATLRVVLGIDRDSMAALLDADRITDVSAEVA